MDTREKILIEAVKLFAHDGFDAVTVEMIAEAVGIKAPSLYKHYRSKQDIFTSIIKDMERMDEVNAAASGMPDGPQDEKIDLQGFMDYCRKMFRYWTEDVFACSFRRMLTVEQYKSPEMSRLYHQYLGSGPLGYTKDIVGSDEAAVALYGPMHLLYSIYDSTSEKRGQGFDDAAYMMLDTHLKNWYQKYVTE